jgi:hypothetical protein
VKEAVAEQRPGCARVPHKASMLLPPGCRRCGGLPWASQGMLCPCASSLATAAAQHTAGELRGLLLGCSTLLVGCPWRRGVPGVGHRARPMAGSPHPRPHGPLPKPPADQHEVLQATTAQSGNRCGSWDCFYDVWCEPAGSTSHGCGSALGEGHRWGRCCIWATAAPVQDQVVCVAGWSAKERCPQLQALAEARSVMAGHCAVDHVGRLICRSGPWCLPRGMGDAKLRMDAPHVPAGLLHLWIQGLVAGRVAIAAAAWQAQGTSNTHPWRR